MAGFLDLLESVWEWFVTEVVSGFYNVIFNSEVSYFRYVLYVVFFILFAEFAVDIFISLLLSFRMRRLILIRPFDLKKFSLIKEYKISPSVNSVRADPKYFSLKSSKEFFIKNKVATQIKDIKPDNYVKPFRIPQSYKFYQSYLKTFVPFPPKLYSALSPKIYSAVSPKLYSALSPKIYSAVSPKLYSPVNLKSFSIVHPIISIRSYYAAHQYIKHNRFQLMNIYNSRLSDKNFVIRYPSFKTFSLQTFRNIRNYKLEANYRKMRMEYKKRQVAQWKRHTRGT